jgi:hypothetical protein
MANYGSPSPAWKAEAMNVPYLPRFFAAAAFVLLNPLAAAAADCSKVPDQYRAACEEGQRVQAKCAGLSGEDLKQCQQKNVQYSKMRQDCSVLSGTERTQCEARNSRDHALDVCQGKAGDELRACAQSVAAGRAGK